MRPVVSHRLVAKERYKMNTRSRRPKLELLLLAFALLLWPAVPAAWAQDDTTPAEEEPVGSYGTGFSLFQRYCRSCHGKSAEGDGHVAPYLKIEPTNLKRLAIENDGEFPTERVLRSVDGRELSIPVHGREMPIWGAVFQVDEDQSEADVQKKLADLVAYLKGIQVNGDGSKAD